MFGDSYRTGTKYFSRFFSIKNRPFTRIHQFLLHNVNRYRSNELTEAHALDSMDSLCVFGFFIFWCMCGILNSPNAYLFQYYSIRVDFNNKRYNGTDFFTGHPKYFTVRK